MKTHLCQEARYKVVGVLMIFSLIMVAFRNDGEGYFSCKTLKRIATNYHSMIDWSTVLEAMGAEKQYLNGAEVKSVSSVFKFAGAKFIYTRHGNKESLNALGPLTDRIKVKVSL